MNFKQSFEKVAFLGSTAARVVGKGLSAVGKKTVALSGGGLMGTLNVLGTGAQAAGDYSDYGKKMRVAQMR